MAGIFTAQNKVRPGAYVVLKGVSNSGLTSGSRGVVAIPMSLPWGDTSALIEISAGDFTRGETLSKLGLTIDNPEAQALKEVFKNATKALVGRLNSNVVKASTTFNVGDDSVVATAKFGGSLGNRISLAWTLNESSEMEMVVAVDSTEVVRQVVTDLSSVVENDWVTFSAEEGSNPVFTEQVVKLGTTIEGTDGIEIREEDYTSFTSKCATETWNTMAIPETTFQLGSKIKMFIENMRENEGKKVQAVVYDYPDANYEGIISVDQGYTTSEGEVISPASFVAYVAGMTAGADIVESNTYKLIEGAVSIQNAKTASEIEKGLEKGMLMLSYRQDRSVVIEKDINTLYNFPKDRTYPFSKNRVLRCLDDIATQIPLRFEKSYIGKVDNNESGRTLFKGDVVKYMNELQTRGAIQNFDSTKDVEILAGNDIESVVCNIAVQPVDAMEKMYITVQVS